MTHTSGGAAVPADDDVEEDHQQADDADVTDTPHMSCWEQQKKALEK